jgi:hypothetical protein
MCQFFEWQHLVDGRHSMKHHFVISLFLLCVWRVVCLFVYLFIYSLTPDRRLVRRCLPFLVLCERHLQPLFALREPLQSEIYYLWFIIIYSTCNCRHIFVLSIWHTVTIAEKWHASKAERILQYKTIKCKTQNIQNKATKHTCTFSPAHSRPIYDIECCLVNSEHLSAPVHTSD